MPTASEDCFKSFEEMKLTEEYRYILFTLNEDETEIVVHKKCKDSSEKEFIESFPEQSLMWGVLDVHYKTANGERKKLVFISWVSDDLQRATFRESAEAKMNSVTFRGSLLNRLEGISCKYEAHDHSDLSLDQILEKVGKNEREPIDKTWNMWDQTE